MNDRRRGGIRIGLGYIALSGSARISNQCCTSLQQELRVWLQISLGCSPPMGLAPQHYEPADR